MRAGRAKRRPSNSVRTRWSRYSVNALAASRSTSAVVPAARKIFLRCHMRPGFYLPEYGFPVARLLIEDMPSDFRNTLFLLGPIGLDVGGVEMRGALELRRVALVIDGFRDRLRAMPVVARRIGQGVEFGPGKGAHETPPERVPVLLVHHLAHGVGKAPRRPAVHGDFRHGVLSRDRLPARLEVHVAREAGQALPMELAHALAALVLGDDRRIKGEHQRGGDGRGKDHEQPQRHGYAVPGEREATR